MSATPGIGIIGQGFMGRAHAHALLALPHMTGPSIRPRLVNVAGRDERALRESAERFGFERHTSDWRELVADPDVDVVHTLEPNRLHAEPAMRTGGARDARGHLTFDLERPGKLWVNGRRELTDPVDWWPTGHVLGWEHTFIFELRRVLDAVAGNGPVAPHGATFLDGLRAAEACDAILRSAAEGRRVDLTQQGATP